MHRKICHPLLGYCAALFILIGSWSLLAHFVAKPFLPPPGAVFRELAVLVFSGKLPMHFLISKVRVLTSIALAVLFAVPLGLFAGRNRRADSIFAPLLYLLYPLPKIAFLPVIILLLGLGDLPKIFLISLITFFQVLVTSRDAARNIPGQWLLSLYSLNATSWQTFIHLILPSSLPGLFTALRVSLGTAIAVLFTAETFASTSGLGYFILDSMERRSYSAMYSGILALGFLGIFCYAAVDFLENKLCPWNRTD